MARSGWSRSAGGKGPLLSGFVSFFRSYTQSKWCGPSYDSGADTIACCDNRTKQPTPIAVDAASRFQTAATSLTKAHAFICLSARDQTRSFPHYLPHSRCDTSNNWVSLSVDERGRRRHRHLSRQEVENRASKAHPGGQSSHWASVYSDVEFEKVPAGQG